MPAYARVRNICAHPGRLWNVGVGVYPVVIDGGARNSSAGLLISTLGSALVNVVLDVLLVRRRRSRAVPSIRGCLVRVDVTSPRREPSHKGVG
jgi:hypothetical protein